MAAQIIPFRPRPANDDGNPTPASGPAQIVALHAARSSDPVRDFDHAYHAAMIARAEHDLVEAKFLAMHFLNPVGARNLYWEQRQDAFARMWDAVDLVAALPAMNANQLRRKKTAIGSVWLRAEGERYDAYRHAVAADEHRIGTKKTA